MALKTMLYKYDFYISIAKKIYFTVPYTTTIHTMWGYEND